MDVLHGVTPNGGTWLPRRPEMSIAVMRDVDSSFLASSHASRSRRQAAVPFLMTMLSWPYCAFHHCRQHGSKQLQQEQRLRRSFTNQRMTHSLDRAPQKPCCSFLQHCTVYAVLL